MAVKAEFWPDGSTSGRMRILPAVFRSRYCAWTKRVQAGPSPVQRHSSRLTAKTKPQRMRTG